MSSAAEAALAQRAEQNMWASFVRACPREVVVDLGVDSTRVADGLAICFARLPSPIINRAIAFGIDRPIDERELDETVGFFDERGAAGFAFQTSPFTRPAEVERWLRTRGFSPRDQRIQLLRDVGPVRAATTSLRTGPVTVDEAESFGRVVTKVFGMPDHAWPGVASMVGDSEFRCFGSWNGAELVGTGVLFLNGDVGNIGFASTLPRARGLGGQSALLRARIDAARAAGCRYVAAQTHGETPEARNPSLHNMLRTGFREIVHESIWQR